MKKLCKISKKKFKSFSKEPTYKCKKCGLLSDNPKELCKAKTR